MAKSKLLFIIVCYLIFADANIGVSIGGGIGGGGVGGCSEISINDEGFIAAYNAIENDLNQKAKDNNIALINPEIKEVTKQVVAGINYAAKIKYSDDAYAFIRIWAKLDRTYELTDAIFNKKADDALTF